MTSLFVWSCRHIAMRHNLSQDGVRLTLTKFEVIFYRSEDNQAFIAEVPEIPGCAGDGKTHRDALRNVEGIIQEWLETARALGRPIPKPKGRLVFA